MNLQDQINEIVEKHNAIIAQNPTISEIGWLISDIPYNDIREYAEQQGKTLNPCNGRFFLNTYPNDFTTEGRCLVTLWSTPVKIKTHYEVLEEEAA